MEFSGQDMAESCESVALPVRPPSEGCLPIAKNVPWASRDDFTCLLPANPSYLIPIWRDGDVWNEQCAETAHAAAAGTTWNKIVTRLFIVGPYIHILFDTVLLTVYGWEPIASPDPMVCHTILASQQKFLFTHTRIPKQSCWNADVIPSEIYLIARDQSLHLKHAFQVYGRFSFHCIGECHGACWAASLHCEQWTRAQEAKRICRNCERQLQDSSEVLMNYSPSNISTKRWLRLKLKSNHVTRMTRSLC